MLYRAAGESSGHYREDRVVGRNKGKGIQMKVVLYGATGSSG